jgi:hypothetical protein
LLDLIYKGKTIKEKGGEKKEGKKKLKPTANMKGGMPGKENKAGR